MLILASASPRRRELLRAAGIRHRIIPHAAAEPGATGQGLRYSALVQRAALAKAQSVARAEGGLVLGADTLVVCRGLVLGKPADEQDARRMLQWLSGRWHHVYTGLALVEGGRRMTAYERTEVAFRKLSNREIDAYVGTGEPAGKAGAYAIQGRGAALVREIRGCYTNVVGLPLPKLMEMLAAFGTEAAAAAAPLRGEV
jgi:septum formation protein